MLLILIILGVIMATMDTVREIEDFSDLGKDFEFNYLGTHYIVPPIPPAKAKRLIKISSDIGRKSTKIYAEGDTISKEVMEEIDKTADEMFTAQVAFIVASGIKKYTGEDRVLTNVDVSEIEEVWSTKLVLKIFEKINNIIFGADIQEKKS
jgi:hypothetical protein